MLRLESTFVRLGCSAASVCLDCFMWWGTTAAPHVVNDPIQGSLPEQCCVLAMMTPLFKHTFSRWYSLKVVLGPTDCSMASNPSTSPGSHDHVVTKALLQAHSLRPGWQAGHLYASPTTAMYEHDQLQKVAQFI